MGLATVAAALACAPVAFGASSFHPRIGRAMGLVPAAGRPEIAVLPREPVVFHGGTVMRGAHLHTVFWAPPRYAFGASPGSGAPAYEPLVQGFLADTAHDSGATGNVFSVLAQYGDGSGPGSYALTYNAATDSIDDADPFPAAGAQCQSPAGLTACVTDLQLERELDRVVSTHDPAGRGLHDLWIVLLPPGVDECSQARQCGTSAFAGYHSLFDLGHGATVYAVIVDPLIEQVSPPGSDPQGNPEAEQAADTVAHEVVEAITDPEGTGWMDPDGFEVGDKCEATVGAPLDYAPDGSPFNQLIAGHQYLVQAMWSNGAAGCVQSAPPAPAPDLARVRLRQYSATVSGEIGSARAGVSVVVALLRGGDPVALGHTRTRTGGGWRTTLRSIYSGAPVAVGDDRDLVSVRYGGGGPAPDLIATDGGGNPFTESGWTGWFDLDHGFAVGAHAVAVAPCGQTGVLTLARSGRVAGGSLVDQCQTETDVAVLDTARNGPGTALTFSSTDDRAVWPGNPAGALVTLTVALGEPHAVPAVDNDQVLLRPSGFPACTADLRAQTVRCSGLVARARYTLARSRGPVLRGRADGNGVIRFAAPWLGGGEVLALRNRAGRAVSALHVARLRVALRGGGRSVAAGRCEPDAYWGAPVSAPPVGGGVGEPSVAGTGTVCRPDGHAAGLPVAASGVIEQSDSFSAGLTRTEVPELGSQSPTPGETLYGPFVALAVPVLPGTARPVPARVSLLITARAGHHVVRRLSGVERSPGVAVSALAPGVYDATWTVTDANGDTRTSRSWFVQEP